MSLKQLGAAPAAGSTDTATTAYVDTASGLLVPKSAFTTKGDIQVASAASTPARLGVGAFGQTLLADSSAGQGMRWGSPASLRDKYSKPSAIAYETIPNGIPMTANVAITSGRLYLMAIALPLGFAVSTITFVSFTQAAVTPTHWWFGLYNSSLLQLAVTADQLTAAWAANADKTLNVATTAAGAAASFTTTYEGLHYLGITVAAATPPTLQSINVGPGTAAMVPLRFGASNTGLTAPPAFPTTATAITSVSSQVYAGVG